ncbi:NERD domain-containing protein [Heliorestis acidaminivorans]|nr:NERD domain-containing protein [Heliorestis acidaminivorans]
MADFFICENSSSRSSENSPGAQSESLVWNKIMNAFHSRDAIACWHFPLFSQIGQHFREPDILIFDRQLGAIVIEVKGISIDNIKFCQGHQWHMEEYYQEVISPYNQAMDQLVNLLSIVERDKLLFRKVAGRILIALLQITEQEWEQSELANQVAPTPIIFGDKRINLQSTTLQKP